MTTNQSVNPHNMNEAELCVWADNHVDRWNLNASFLDIVEDLKREGIRSDSREFKILVQQFNIYFRNATLPVTEVVRDLLAKDEYV